MPDMLCYSYDEVVPGFANPVNLLDRLTSGFTTSDGSCAGADSTGADPYQVAYTYDPIGNITSAAGTETVNGDYVYHPTKRHAVTSAGPDNSYTYDASGNQEERNIDGVVQTLAYDVQNRIVGNTGGDAAMDALYDAEGNRVYRKLGRTPEEL